MIAAESSLVLHPARVVHGYCPGGDDPAGLTMTDKELQPGPRDEAGGRRRAAGIYGAIITASIMTAAGAELTTIQLALSVLVTLVAYWLGEQYAEILGEHAAGGRIPSWTYIHDALATSWPIVSASFAPIAVLAISRVAGASESAAADLGIAASLVLLTAHGWAASRAARLTGWRLAAATAIAAVLGVAMVALKNLTLHLH
jgi:hypothetical protein